MSAEIIAKRICINGIVQGVGFRPFIYQLARREGLYGQVANNAEGVIIDVEGPAAGIAAFVQAIDREKPPLAQIVNLTQQVQTPAGRTRFSIAPSQGADFRATLISPDVAVCEDCRRELFDPADRRYGYPFINCTNCGPRYTIIEDIPYDRPKTAMRHFRMCRQCQAEYDDPEDRRFHAQPNACAVCGPRVTLCDKGRQPLAQEDPIARSAELLKSGYILAIKGLGGFHLAVDAVNDAAVARLRARKMREEKPLAVMSADLETVDSYVHLDEDSARLLTSMQRPIVLLPKKLPEKLAFSVSPRNHYYGVMLPYTPLHYLLLSHGFKAVVMTSGNLSEEPIAIDNDEAFERLGSIADYFLIHDREIYLRSDDSIVRHAAGETRLIRRSRGYVPVPIFLKKELPPVLACGAEQKNTICLTKGRQAFLSQHIGDLENMAAEHFFCLTIDHLKRILDIEPEMLACDMHPDYLSTQWARQQTDTPLMEIQHHHAHVAACLAEHQLQCPVLGLAFDGTGYGPDNTVWGGEVLMADLAGFRRLAHLEPATMPGAAAAIKEPWRMGLAYLYHVFGDELWDLDLPLLRDLDREKGRILTRAMVRGLNAPLTSSLGRLFDGVAAIIGLRQRVAYEGQAAMELEMIADGQEQSGYAFQLLDGPVRRAALGPIVRGLVADLLAQVPAFVISRRFHQTMVNMWTELVNILGRETRLRRVVLSGGCFQNALLLEGLSSSLAAKGFEVYTHRLVPTNDGGIALGQAVIAAARAAGHSTKVDLP